MKAYKINVDVRIIIEGHNKVILQKFCSMALGSKCLVLDGAQIVQLIRFLFLPRTFDEINENFTLSFRDEKVIIELINLKIIDVIKNDITN
ncbi:hypothetical protein [Atlantibacter sp.]|uniref:hypothetical protein n=1 Tax=Atlantibacter sp. TaxID=1903473 RepID=UPI0028A8B261|nr:hypothetical protein [Atlantibacter sp.]